MKKKAVFRDLFFITILVFVFAFGILFVLRILTSFNTSIQAMAIVPAAAKTAVNTITTRAPMILDGAFILLWVLLMIVGLILALQVQTNALYLVISIIYFIFLIFITKIFSVLYARFVSNVALASVNSTLLIIPFLMARLPLFTFVFGAIIIAFMVVKR